MGSGAVLASWSEVLRADRLSGLRERRRRSTRACSPWWSELHRVAKLRADRATGFKGKIAARVWEKQKRGLAHLHGVISVSTPAELRWAEAYVTALREMAPRRGSASSTAGTRSGRKIKPGIEAAAYCRVTSCGARDGRCRSRRTCWPGTCPACGVHRTRTDREDGCTMRNLRNARRLWASREGLTSPPIVAVGRVAGGCSRP